MTPKRKKIQDHILKVVGRVVSGNYNLERYKRFFDKATDEEFEAYMKGLDEGRYIIDIEAPVLSTEAKLDLDNLLDVAKDIGCEIFERIVYYTKSGKPYMTPDKKAILMVPIRRQAQTMEAGVSVPSEEEITDDLTGQPVGDSRGASFTYPEFQNMAAWGLPNCIRELVGVRGGDRSGYRAMRDDLADTGQVSLDAIESRRHGRQAIQTLSILFNMAMMKNTLR